jgi:dihydroorotate dehydrogenase (NAD+) catalytic subunit
MIRAMADLTVKLGKLKLQNPVILASGICDITAELMLAAVDGGAGAVVTKSIGSGPRAGHKGPSVVETGCGLLNAMGLPNPGMELFQNEISMAADEGAIVVVSVFGKTPGEFAGLAKLAEGAGAKAIELNLSCPHAKGYGAELGTDPAAVKNITRAVRRAVKIPVMPKLTPNTSDVVGLAKAAEAGGADAVVAINTLKGMKIDIDFARPALGNRVGGYSGPGIKPVGVRCVYEIAGAVKIPVVGAGGIENGWDAAEYVMAGASAVQVGSAVWRRGMGVFGDINGEMEAFMDSRRYPSVKSMVGLARRAE